MQRVETSAPPLRAEAIVFRVDTINRELTVDAGGARVAVDVPPDCLVILHGERVKLRLIQPGDRVHITYTQAGNRRVAHTLQVRDGLD